MLNFARFLRGFLRVKRIYIDEKYINVEAHSIVYLYFFISILGVTFHDYKCMTYDDVLFIGLLTMTELLLPQDNYQVFSTDCNNFTLFKYNDIIILYTLSRTLSTRAPPA